MASQTVFGTALMVVGSEQLLADREVAARVQAARKECPSVELVELRAPDLGDGEFAQVIGGSLFSVETVVVIQDLANLPDELVNLVVDTAAHVPENLCLTMVHEGGLKGRGLVTALTKVGIPSAAAKPLKPSELPSFVINEARSARIRIDIHAAQALVEAVGADLRSLSGAINQLASDWEGQQLTADMINRYFAGRADVTSFKVADDTLAGQTGEAMVKLRWALSTGVAPVLITSAVAIQLRALGKYLDVRSSGMGQSEMARRIGVPPWKIRSLDKQAKTWSASSVARAIAAVAKADAEVKGAAIDPEFALEAMVLAIATMHANQS